MKARDDSEWRSLVPGKTGRGRQTAFTTYRWAPKPWTSLACPFPRGGAWHSPPARAPRCCVLARVPSVLRSLRGPSASFSAAERSPCSLSSSAVYPHGNRLLHERLSFPRSARGAGDVHLARGSVRKGWSRPVQSERECGPTRVGLPEGPGAPAAWPGVQELPVAQPKVSAWREVLGCLSVGCPSSRSQSARRDIRCHIKRVWENLPLISESERQIRLEREHEWPLSGPAALRLAGLPGKAWGWAVWEMVFWLHSLIAQRFGPPRLAAVAPDQN